MLFPWRRKWQPTAVFLPGESRGQAIGEASEADPRVGRRGRSLPLWTGHPKTHVGPWTPQAMSEAGDSTSGPREAAQTHRTPPWLWTELIPKAGKAQAALLWRKGESGWGITGIREVTPLSQALPSLCVQVSLSLFLLYPRAPPPNHY